jgi:hypothetical protein
MPVWNSAFLARFPRNARPGEILNIAKVCGNLDVIRPDVALSGNIPVFPVLRKLLALLRNAVTIGFSDSARVLAWSTTAHMMMMMLLLLLLLLPASSNNGFTLKLIGPS